MDLSGIKIPIRRACRGVAPWLMIGHELRFESLAKKGFTPSIKTVTPSDSKKFAIITYISHSLKIVFAYPIKIYR